mmetsp:Transcript_11717/g.10351  ORF Transcript_11717/g.10351 Transcript_11717/m.10351 type:complete len:147 (+) Transcript_11717:3-443(+)
MPHLISNLVEKAYTPSIARIAPRHLVRKPQLGRQAQKVTNIGRSAAYKHFWRFTRRWVCHNHKLYYSYIILSALAVYNVYFAVVVGYYRSKNYTRSMEYAIMREEEWQKNKPAEDDDEWFGDDDEEGDDEEEGAAEDAGDDEDDDE